VARSQGPRGTKGEPTLRMLLRGLTGARDEFHLVQNLKTLANYVSRHRRTSKLRVSRKRDAAKPSKLPTPPAVSRSTRLANARRFIVRLTGPGSRQSARTADMNGLHPHGPHPPRSSLSLKWKGADFLPRLPEEIRNQTALVHGFFRMKSMLIGSVRHALRRSAARTVEAAHGPAPHTEFSIIAMIGVILVIGIVKKNAILMTTRGSGHGTTRHWRIRHRNIFPAHRA
jgi:hypothetical protein